MHGSHGHDKKPHASQHDKHAVHRPEQSPDIVRGEHGWKSPRPLGHEIVGRL